MSIQLLKLLKRVLKANKTFIIDDQTTVFGGIKGIALYIRSKEPNTPVEILYTFEHIRVSDSQEGIVIVRDCLRLE